MASAAILAIAGFTALGSIFDYPKILKEPTDEILTAYRADQAAISGWFLVLVISAALLAPIGILLGRLAAGSAVVGSPGSASRRPRCRSIGLSRWVVLVPHVGTDTFELLHTWLGEVLGETIGYALTAAFTVFVVRAIAAPRWLSIGGVRVRRAHRDRRRDPDRRGPQPHELRRLRAVVPVADRDERRAVASHAVASRKVSIA